MQMSRPGTVALSIAIAGVLLAGATDVEAQRRRRRRRQPEQAPGSLVLEGAVDGAEVLIDEESVGFTPLDPLELPVGSHTLRVRRSGYTEFASVVEIRPAETSTVAVEIMALAMVLTVRTVPEEASVFVDGTFRGTTPLELELNEGDHSIRITASRHHEAVREVTALAGQTQLLSVDLEPLPAELLEARPIEWYEEPLTWILAGGGVALLTVALVIIVAVATEPSQEDDFCQMSDQRPMGCDLRGVVMGWTFP